MKDKEPNMGLIELEKYMLPGEVHITNTYDLTELRMFHYACPQFGVSDEDVLATPEDEANLYRKSGKYRDGTIRVIPIAFDSNGDLLPNKVTIVGIPKSIQE